MWASASEGPCSSNRRSTSDRPKPWSGTGSVISVRSSPCLWVMAPVSSPMRSTRPEASEAPESGSTSWYLMEEEPELITRTVR